MKEIEIQDMCGVHMRTELHVTEHVTSGKIHTHID